MSAGVVHESVAVPAESEATTLVGAPETVIVGMTGGVTAEGALEPRTLTAKTLKIVALPLARPVRVMAVAVEAKWANGVQLRPPSIDDCTV